MNFQASDPSWSRRIAMLSHAGFLVAVGLAAWFHDLRSTFGYSAAMLFDLINAPDLWAATTWITPNWFQNVVTILAVKMGLPLTVVSILFSASPMVFAYGLFGLCFYGFKRKFSGIFLLSLLLGVNFTFFGAVGTTYIELCWVYVFVAFLSWLLAPRFVSQTGVLRAFWEFALFGGMAALVCLSANFRPSFYDVLGSDWYFSLWRYVGGVVLNSYVVVGAMAAYLGLFWVVRKAYKTLGTFLGFLVLLLGLVMWRGGQNLFVWNYESLFLPLIAVVLMAMNGYVWERFPMNKTRFNILTIIVLVAIGGQLRNLPIFEKRQAEVVRLLKASTAVPAEKIALSENLQRVERYIDPTFLPYETPILSAFHHIPLRSIHFIPATDTLTNTLLLPNLPTTANPRYFPFTEQGYSIIGFPLMHRKLVYDTLIVHELRDVYTGNSAQYAITTFLKDLQKGDSVQVSVRRRGSDNGNLIVSDLYNPSFVWIRHQTTSEPDERGWQTLSSAFIVGRDTRLKTYVWNSNYKQEFIYFNDFRIKIWRE